jgi:hypothetical protein
MAGSQLHAMPHSGESRLLAMRHSTESIFVVESNRITPRIRIYIKTILAHDQRTQGYSLTEKTRGRKSRENVSLIRELNLLESPLRNIDWPGLPD